MSELVYRTGMDLTWKLDEIIITFHSRMTLELGFSLDLQMEYIY